MSNSRDSAATYRDELRRWVPALAGFQSTGDMGDALAADSALVGLKLFAEGNLKKRRTALETQLEFVAEAFDDLQELVSAYLRCMPPIAYEVTASDGERFLSWLERTGEPTPRQRDYIACQQARLAVEAAARADPSGYRRFQELWRMTPQFAAELDTTPRLQVSLNPIRAWSRFATTALLDDDAALPADVLFFVAGGEIRTAVLDHHGRMLVEELASCGPCTLDEWLSASRSIAREELVPLYRDLAEMGLIAIAIDNAPPPFIESMEEFANEGGMLPEQLWDADDLPEEKMKLGGPTGAAMPLCRAHASFSHFCGERDRKGKIIK